jgi:murein DD-endopeptidase MepM/ murein hydrolase activator NlpD
LVFTGLNQKTTIYLALMSGVSLKAAEATFAQLSFGQKVRLTTAMLKEQALAWLATPMGMATVAVTGISLLVSGISWVNQKLEENKQKLKEVAQEASKQADESAKAVSTLSDLKTQLTSGTKSSNELTSAFKEQLKAMGYTEGQIDALINKYGGLSGAIDEATRKALENARTDAHTDVATSSKSLETTYDPYGMSGDTKSTVRLGEYDSIGNELRNKILEIMKPVAIDIDSLMGTITMGANSDSAEDIYAYYQGLQQVVQLIQETASKTNNEELLNSSVYKEASETLKELGESAKLYGDAINRLHSADAKIELADYLKTNDINNQEAFDSYIEGIKNSTEYSDAYKQVLIDVANDAFPQFSNAAKEAGENANEMTVQLEDLKNASDGISKISDAFNSLSEDGFIPVEKIAEIKDAVGESIDNWEDYEKILLTAKSGSAELNNALSDLTYATLDAQFASVGLENATEEQIAAILRENDVANADALAIEYLARAKAQAAIDGTDFSNVENLNIQSLIDEGVNAGITGAQMYNLILSHIQFNNTNLNPEQKVAALMQIAQAAGIASAEINKIFGASTTSSWEDKTKWMNDNGVTATEDAQGRTGKTKDGKTYNYKDYMYNGIRYDTVDDVNAAITADKVKSQMDNQNWDFSAPQYTPKSSGSFSKKDTSADDAKKKAEEEEKKRIEAFKEGLEARKDILDRYKAHLESLDFGLDLLSEEDFEGQFDVLTLKLEQATEYGKELKAEFEEAASTIPQTGEEAEALGAHLESLGSDIRSNIKDINEMTVALEKAKIGMLSGQAQGYIDEMSREIDSLERRIKILRADDKNDYKYTNEILRMEMFLPNQSTINEKVREKSKEDREIIKMEQETQDTLDGILRTQIEKNEKLRADERAKLLVNMEELKVNTQKKINEVQASYEYSLQQNEENTQESCDAIASMIDSTDVQFPDPYIDFSKAEKQFDDFGKVVDRLDKKAFSLAKSLGLISEYSGTSTPKPMPGTSGSGGSEGGMPFDNLLDAKNGIDGTSETLGGSFDEKLKDFETKIDEWLDQHSGDGYPFEKKYNISSYYGYRIHPIYGYRKFHSGVDFNAPFGAKILSVSSGTVELSSWNGGYGNCIIVRDGSGNKWLYGHMAEQSVLGVGDKVGKGQVIGYVGSTGLSTGPHLHLERRTSDNSTVDPLPHLPYYAKGTLKGNLLAKKLGIAGENYKSEILVDKSTGKMEYIDTPTLIDTTKTDVIGEKATANIPKFADGSVDPADIARYIRKTYPQVLDTGIAAVLSNIYAESGFNPKAKTTEKYGSGRTDLVDRYGFFQLDTERYSEVKNTVENHPWERQIDMMLYEGGELGSDIGYDIIENILTNPDLSAEEAARLFATKYERCAADCVEAHIENANEYLNQLPGWLSGESSLPTKELSPEIKELEEIIKSFDEKYKDADATYKSSMYGIYKRSDEDKEYAKNDALTDSYDAAKAKFDIVSEAGTKAFNDVLWAYNNYLDNGGNDLKVIEAYEEALLDLRDAVVRTEDDMVELKDTVLTEGMERRIEEVERKIEDANLYGDWGEFGNELGAIQKELEIYTEYFKSGYLSEQKFNELKRGLDNRAYSTGKEMLISAVEKLLKDEEKKLSDEKERLSLRTSKFDSQQSLWQGYYDTINSVEQEYHNINKELQASMTMSEYLAESSKKLLFNQKDYNVLAKELNGIQTKAKQIRIEYDTAIESASKETLPRITAEYQRQYNILMKKYEIAKADLEVAKKRQQLDNVLNERNTRMFINGQWRWVAKTQDVINAQNELAEAEFAKQQSKEKYRQQLSLDEFSAMKDQNEELISFINKDIEDWREKWDDIQEQLNAEAQNLTEVLKSLAESGVPKLEDIVASLGSSLAGLYRDITGEELTLPSQKTDVKAKFKIIPSSDGGYYTSATLPDGMGSTYVHVNKEGKTTTEVPKGTVVHTDGRDYEITGGTPGNYESKLKKQYWSWDSEYASGTKNAKSGRALIGEEPEVLITNGMHLIPINQPTIANLRGGEMVINQMQMRNLRDMWDMANVWNPSSKDLINRNISSSSGDTNCNNIYINGVKIDDNSGIINVDALKRYIANHS